MNDFTEILVLFVVFLCVFVIFKFIEYKFFWFAGGVL